MASAARETAATDEGESNDKDQSENTGKCQRGTGLHGFRSVTSLSTEAIWTASRHTVLIVFA